MQPNVVDASTRHQGARFDVHVIGTAPWCIPSEVQSAITFVAVDAYPDAEPRLSVAVGQARRAVVMTSMYGSDGQFDQTKLTSALGAVVALRQHGYEWTGLAIPEVPAARQDRPTSGTNELAAGELMRLLIDGVGIDALIVWDVKPAWATSVQTPIFQPSVADRARLIAAGWARAAMNSVVPAAPSVVVAPDQSAQVLAESVAREVGAPSLTLNKHRRGPESVSTDRPPGDGATVDRYGTDPYLIVDDMVVSAATLCAAARQVDLPGGAWVYASHFRPTPTGVRRLVSAHEAGLVKGTLLPDFISHQAADFMPRIDVGATQVMSHFLRLAAHDYDAG